MLPIVSLFVVLIISMLIVRIATVALTLTGISKQLARFQARSAFTGSGFTTSESEKVLQHPVRRRIIMLLMLLGNAGIVTVISSLILSLTGTDESAGIRGELWFKLVILFSGLSVLWLIAHSQMVDKYLSRYISWTLKNWTDLEIRDYAGLLHLTGGYVVAELSVGEGDWMVDKTLKELKLPDEGILVLGIEHQDGSYDGVPRGTSVFSVGDTLLLYGKQKIIANLDVRRQGPEGNWEHHKNVEKQLQEKIDK